jgi:hypothetical protein
VHVTAPGVQATGVTIGCTGRSPDPEAYPPSIPGRRLPLGDIPADPKFDHGHQDRRIVGSPDSIRNRNSGVWADFSEKSEYSDYFSGANSFLSRSFLHPGEISGSSRLRGWSEDCDGAGGGETGHGKFIKSFASPNVARSVKPVNPRRIPKEKGELKNSGFCSS